MCLKLRYASESKFKRPLPLLYNQANWAPALWLFRDLPTVHQELPWPLSQLWSIGAFLDRGGFAFSQLADPWELRGQKDEGKRFWVGQEATSRIHCSPDVCKAASLVLTQWDPAPQSTLPR